MEESDEFFKLFTPESLFNIEQRIAEEEAQKKIEKQALEEGEEEETPIHEEEEAKPNPKFEAGKKLPLSLQDEFPPEYIGKPLEDFDEYYDSQKTFVVVGKDKSIYRFSATNALYLLSPFNPVRRGAIYILVHPLFSALIIITIIVNCAFMAMTENPVPDIEYVFTGVYTVEAAIKITARGFIIHNFTYLRDPWNWLDFIVIALAYLTMGVNLGNLSALRTFRVLRALKTVAVIPGLKTIVGALLEAVRRLRDVGILTVFMLSIFALIGMQLYMASLQNKCVKTLYANMTDEEFMNHITNESNWEMNSFGEPLICGNGTGAGQCSVGYICMNNTGSNPNWGYTHFDNFAVALLCAFRLMTQDYWENLYQITLRANGPWHCLYFMIVILLGSFYLLNLILAIVAMSYDEQQKQDKADSEEEEAERKRSDRRRQEKTDEIERELQYRASLKSHKMQEENFEEKEEIKREYQEYLEEKLSHVTKSPSETSISSRGEHTQDNISIHSEKTADEHHLTVAKKPPSFSLPGSPFVGRAGSWGKKPKHVLHTNDLQPLMPRLDISPNFPFADDSNAVTPDDICTFKQFYAMRRGSHASLIRRNREGSSRRSSYGSVRSHRSRGSVRRSNQEKQGKLDKLDQDWKMRKGSTHLSPDVVIDKGTSDEENSDFQRKETNGDTFNMDKKFGHNQICHRHGSKDVDPKDMMVLKDLLDNAEGKRRPSMLSGFSMGCEHEEETLRDRLHRKFCSWTCCPCWLMFQKIVALFILDAFMDLFITLCILLNTAFMAMDHHGKSEELGKVLDVGNYVFTGIFAAEAFLKIIALNPVQYVKDGWNCFDIFIVLLSFLELLLGGSGLSVLRSFRLLRVFKLAKSWPTLNMLIRIVGQTMGALGNLTFVLGIVVFIFAVMGQQLFLPSYELYGKNGTEFADEEPSPRWSFKDFLHSFMIVFRVLCGEWIESMWSCTRVAGWPCIPFFLLTMVIGNLVVLNLFLALLLSSFDAVSGGDDNDDDKEPNKIAEALNRFKRFGAWVKVKVIVCLKMRIRRKPKPPGTSASPKESRIDVNGKPEVITDGHTVIGNGTVCETHPPSAIDTDQLTPTAIITETIALLENYEKAENKTPDSVDGEVLQNDYKRRESQSSAKHSGESSCTSLSDDERKLSLTKVNAEGEPEINEVDVTYASYPDECFCKICRKKCPCCIRVENTKFGKRWWKLRCMTYALVEHKYFESFIITMILASSLALAVEDIYLKDRHVLQIVLEVADKFFTVVFIMEMLIKWVAFGWKKYFTDAWCWLDFVIVAISITMLIAESLPDVKNIGAMKAMRTLRALRPLRAVSRWEGMRISIVMLVAEAMGHGQVGALKVMRTLRALRPLRALSRMEGMRVVVNALIKAIPSIANVMLVCLIFWLIFGIVGVQFFSGKFYKCVDKDGNKLPATIVPNKSVCLNNSDYEWKNSRITFDNVLYSYLALFQVVCVVALLSVIPYVANVFLVCLMIWLIFSIVGVQFFAGKFYKCLDSDGNKVLQSVISNKSECLSLEEYGYEWKNSKINFDNSLLGFLALFQVATYKGWIDIMNDAIDTTDVDKQPTKENQPYYYIYFVLFIIFGSFFTLNLFIGVIINNFNQQKKKAGGSLEMFMTEDQKKYYKAMKRMASKSPQKSIPRPSAGSLDMFMTDDQKKYYNAMKRMQSKSPQKSIPRPSIKVIGWIFDVVTNQKFDICIMTVIMLNMFTMAMEHYGQEATFEKVLEYINLSFIIIFTAECVLKLIGLRHYYFKFPWNIFDFIVVVLSILGVALSDVMEAYFVSPTLLRVVRVFRVSRILRLVKSAKGIRTLLFSLAVSIPALFNIGLLLFLVMFIYATFGMSFFMNVKHMYGIDDCFNFETFGRSIIYLFQMCTSAGWAGALDGITNEEDCDPNMEPTNCGNYGIGVFYLVSYLIISFLVVVNMYIAVILENFSQATEDVQQGLTTEDFDVYYEKWEKFDPDATQFIPLDKLSDFVDYLEEPLRLPKPNHFMLVKLDIPICEGDKMYCRDILDALTKNFLGTSETGELGDMTHGDVKEKIQYNPVSSTLKRQKEHYAARIIQKAYRRYRNERGDLPSDNIPKCPPPPEYEAIVNKNKEKSAQDDNSTKKESSAKDDNKPDDVTITISDPDDGDASSENKTVELRADSDVVA